MKILVITQKIDLEDPVLGFFHTWVIKLASVFESVKVICLEKGKSDLPPNVKVYSLGKESGKSNIKYIKNFFNLILGLCREYDSVFVHMNQEYVLLGGFIWKLLRKKIYFWRNHARGSVLTRLAIALSDNVFCTSKDSYTAKFSKTIIMPVGIDMELFQSVSQKNASNKKERLNNSILSLGRISPVKNIHLLVEAAKILKDRGIPFVLNIVGDPVNPEDTKYKNRLIDKSQGLPINFLPGVPNIKTPEIYKSHEIFINLTPSGSFDKTILEAAATGCVLVTCNRELSQYGDSGDSNIADLSPSTIANRLAYYLKVPNEIKDKLSKDLQRYVLENHSLNALIDKLALCIK